MNRALALNASLPQGFRNAAKHTKAELSDWECPSSSVFSHHASPCSPSTDRAEDMDQSIGDKPRSSSRSHEDRRETRTSLHVRLVQHVTEPSKVVAKKVGASPDSVDLYRQGSVPQSWTQLIAYCRAYPAFGLEVLELMGIDIDRDREAYATFLMLQKQVRGQ